MLRTFQATALSGVLFSLAACASSPENNDPFEGYNRAMFSFNETVDEYALKPVAQGYDKVTPDLVQLGVTNFFSNLFYPTVFINQFLQGKPREGFRDMGRFALNTTLGWGGLFDPASSIGLTKNQEDFGQTLGVWGVESGPYIVLPLLGPSSPRGAVGWVGDYFTSPMTYIDTNNETKYGMLGLNVVNTRANLLKKEEVITGDKYIFMRDAYLQRREYLVNDKKTDENDPFLDDK